MHDKILHEKLVHVIGSGTGMCECVCVCLSKRVRERTRERENARECVQGIRERESGDGHFCLVVGRHLTALNDTDCRRTLV